MAWTYENLSDVEDANSVYSPGNPAYFWTVEAYEQIKQNNYNDYVKITTDTKSVNVDFRVRYYVRVWKQNTGNMSPTTGGATPLYSRNGVVVQILDSYKTANAANFEFGSIEQANAGYGQNSSGYGGTPSTTSQYFPYYTDNANYNSNNKELFYFDVKAKKSNVWLQPAIKVKLLNVNDKGLFDSQDWENQNQYDLEVLPHYSVQLPGIQFTKVDATKPIPKIVKQEAWKEHLIAFDRCSTPQRWAAVIREADINPNGYYWSIKYYPINADALTTTQLKQQTTKTIIGYDTVYPSPSAPLGPDKRDSFNDAVLQLNKIRTNTCEEVEDDGSSDTPPFQDSKPVEFDTTTRTNPPNHYTTRSVSHWNKIKGNVLKDLGKPRANFVIPSGRLNILNTETSTAGVLGMVFQDAESAKALNLDTKLPWGFRFIYNPTSISYSTAMDTSIDWILATHDPANYIGGSFGVGFTLYLNRVADMTELAGLKGKWDTYGKNYPRTLRQEEVQGILNRGTEYDLEFLYRVVNGDPQPSDNTLLTYTENGSPAKTADFGYITGTPIWLKIHPNMRYKVSLASMSVNHVIFTEQMIPMFTTVDLQFIRYPVVSDLNADAAKAYNEKQAKYRKGQEEAAKEGQPTTGTNP